MGERGGRLRQEIRSALGRAWVADRPAEMVQGRERAQVQTYEDADPATSGATKVASNIGEYGQSSIAVSKDTHGGLEIYPTRCYTLSLRGMTKPQIQCLEAVSPRLSSKVVVDKSFFMLISNSPC
jgi:hypothetical protein